MVSPVVLLCWLLVAVNATGNDLPATWQGIWDLMKEEFNTFKLQYNKTYASELEEQVRMRNFLHNRQQVALHNERYAQGLVGFWLGINKYSDMLHHEFLVTHTGFNRKRLNTERMSSVRGAMFIPPPEYVIIPDEVDWRKSGAVTPIKDQGEVCGACWAFGATGSLEGQQFRKTGKLVPLSEQNLIDCTTRYGNAGCDGGYAYLAYVYVQENGGLDTEASYPYKAENGWCKYNPKYSGAYDYGYRSIPEGNEQSLKEAVATIGPVSVDVDALLESFEIYGGGVYYNESCRSSVNDVMHTMLVVGYGTDPKEGDYWLIKNSWGTSWGIDGYMMLARNRGNHCGVATFASFPIV